MRLIQSLASKELVRNLPKLKFDQHFCDACKIGKQAHASHKAKNIVSTTRCLELLHMDLFGPSAIRSYKGNRYTLVIVDDYSRVAKDLWERVQLLMQVNTKFLNSLPPEWSKFVTDVKLVKDLHTYKFDQLHAYLEQHELHANEVRIMRERNQDPLAFVANQQMTPPHFNTYQSSYNNEEY
ncbi:retrovirus-related pol polyprotein from transposon TNT 1-94 [Tanacetum coccineum]